MDWVACLGTSTTCRRQLCLKSGGFDLCVRQQNSKQFIHAFKGYVVREGLL